MAGRSHREDLITLIDLFHAMWNTHDLDGILELLAEESVVTMFRSLEQPPVVYHGKAQLHVFVEQALGGCEIRARSHHVIGNRVIWMATKANEALRQLGVEQVEYRTEAAIADGKIVACTLTYTPQTVAKLTAGMPVIRRASAV